MNSNIPNRRCATRFLHAIAASVSLSLLGAGCGGSSEPDAKANLAVPSAPVAVALAGDGQVTLTWDDVDGADSYVVYFGTGLLDTENATRIEPAISPQVIHDLENGIPYFFAVAGKNEAGEGEWSKAVMATPTAALLPPSVPLGVTATAADAQVTVTWSAVEGAEAYELFWSDTSPIHRDTATHVAPVTSPHVVTGLENDTTWYFALIATNAAGESALSNEASATPTKPETVPQPPTNVVAVAGDGEVTLTWDPVASATSYDVVWTDKDELSAANLGAATRQFYVTSPFVVSALTNGTPYRFAVIARNAVGDSDLSQVASATPKAALLPPQPPANVAAIAGDGSVIVSWDLVATATSYDVVWTDENVLTVANLDAATRQSDVTSPLVVSALTNGTTYRFAVIAGNTAGDSDLSEVASATPKAALLPPQPPMNVAAIAGDGSVTVSWEPVATATSYDLFYTDESALNEATATRLSGVASPVELKALTNGTTYLFAVSAVNEAGASALSDSVEATPLPPPPAAPSLVTVEAGIQQLEVSWESDPLADSHAVYVGTATPFVPDEAEVRLSDVTSPVTIPALEPRTSYSVVVISSRMGVKSPPSVETEGTPLAPVPDAPGNVELTVGDEELTVTWTNDAWAVSSDLYYGTESPVSEANATRRDDVTSPVTITGLTNGTRYYVALVSQNESGASDLSNEAEATPLPLPAAPAALTATPGHTRVVLDWEPPAFADSHTLYYRKGAEPVIGDPATIVVSAVDPLHEVTGLENGATYYFAVSASNARGEGPLSGIVQAIPVDDRPIVSGVFPIEGPPLGGIDITLKGEYFDAGTTPRVWFGDVEALPVTVVSDEEISVSLPQAVSSGWVSVRIANEKGETVRDLGFAYSPYDGAARVSFDLNVLAPNATVAVGDFNEDGAVDFALLSGNTQTIEILFGDGKGGVQDQKTLTTGGTWGRNLIAGDFDGDGHLDLAAGHQTFLQVHYGNGTGNFVSSETFAPEGELILNGLAAGDLDGDGLPELVASYKDHGAGIFAANENREWSHVMSLPKQSVSQYGVAVGNFNGEDDTLLDIAVFSSLSNNGALTFYLRDDSQKVGDEPFGFRKGLELSLPGSTWPSFLVRDLNEDGLDDIVVGGRDFVVLTQEANGNFQSVEHNHITEIRVAGAADLDGDGLLDLVVADVWRSEMGVLYADTPGVFGPMVGLGFPAGIVGGAIADFNGDGVLDILGVARPGTKYTATWLLNDAVRRLGVDKDSYRFDDVSYGRAVLTGKFVNGNDTVAVISGYDIFSRIDLFEWTANGLADPITINAGSLPTVADSADFDRDGHPDMVMNSEDRAQITLVRNPGNAPIATNITTPGMVTSLAVGTLDDDDVPGVVLAIPSEEIVQLGSYDDNGGFSLTSLSVRAEHLALGDFDSDGDLDVIYAAGQNLGFITNNQTSWSVEPLDWGHPGAIRRVRTADVDGNGLTDILVLTEGSAANAPDRLFIYLNHGDGFWSVSNHEVGYEASDCVIGDGNGDGVTDIFVTSGKSGAVFYFQGDDEGGFLPHFPIEAGSMPSEIAVLDDGSGRSILFVIADHSRAYFTAVRPR